MDWTWRWMRERYASSTIMAWCNCDDGGHGSRCAVCGAEAVSAEPAPRWPRGRITVAGLHPELKKLGLPAICLETQHVRGAMSAQRNKTDRADGLGIAHIMCTG